MGKFVPIKLFVAGVGVVAAAGIAMAQMAPESAIEKRKNIMKSVGAATGVGGGIAKEEIAFDPKVAKSVLATYLAASHTFPDYFPEGSESGETKAAPAIWEDRAGFEAQVAKFREAADAAFAADPKDLEAFKPLFGSVAANCKSCHEQYRLPSD